MQQGKMMAGRPRKTAAQKFLEGNPSKRPIKQHMSATSTLPDPPAHLNTDAKKIFSDTARELHKVNVMTLLDVNHIEVYATNLARMRKLEALIDEKGMTYELETKSGDIMIRQRPEVALLMQCQRLHRQYATEIGLTPASRTKLPDMGQPDLFDKINQEENAGSEWDQFSQPGLSN